jgi:hypothetical protein
MGKAAKRAEARCCTEYNHVNAEATWTERGYTYPERSASEFSLRAEVSRGYSKPETSCLPEERVKAEVSQTS